jgi:hypothetical protein
MYGNTNKPIRLIWQALEHNHYKKKTADWFWGLGIITAGLAVLIFFFGNFLFGVIIILFAITSSLLANRKPQVVEFEITRKGVRAGNILYPYSSLESFWVDDGEFHDKIIFKTRKSLHPYIIIPFDSTQTNPEVIADFLLDYLNEEEMDEPIHQIFLEILGF